MKRKCSLLLQLNMRNSILKLNDLEWLREGDASPKADILILVRYERLVEARDA